MPALIFNRPGIVNTPRSPQYTACASFFDSIDNWLVDETEIKAAGEQAALEAFLFNTATFFVGYDFPENILSPEEEMAFPHVPNLMDRSRRFNMPYLDMVPAKRMIYAPGTKTIRNCPWAARLLSVPVKALKNKPKVRKKFIQAGFVPDWLKRSLGNKWMQDDLNMHGFQEVYQVHDAEKQEWFWLTESGEFLMGPEEDPFQIDGLPFEHLTFNKDPDTIWGTPDSLYIETQFRELNEIKRDSRKQRRVALLKAFVLADVLSDEQKDKLINGDPMSVIEVENMGDRKIQDVIMTLQPHVQLEFREEKKDILNEAQLLAGTGPNQVGTFAPGRRTKFEAQIVEERSLLRTGSRRNKLADNIAGIVSKYNQYILENWNAPIVMQVLGVDGALYWVSAPPAKFKNISSQLTTKVNVESMAPISRDRKKEELMALIQTLTKFPGANPLPLIQSFVSSFDWGDVSKVLPVGNNQPLSLGEFQNDQASRLQDPNVGGIAAGNLQNVGRTVNALPQLQEAGNA
tara:strand:+ start:7432 stop:8979 length:1548 start_codon:yes stop_codon:yes gene_type:complete